MRPKRSILAGPACEGVITRLLGGAECSVKLLAGAPDGRTVGDELTVAHSALACFEVKKDDEDETVKVIVLSCWDEDSAALVGE